MASVEFKKLVKRSGTIEVVHAIDLLIADGEFIVLVGPSGCGKSTTLRMPAGLEDISDGEILIEGRTVNEIEPRDRDIGMLFQLQSGAFASVRCGIRQGARPSVALT